MDTAYYINAMIKIWMLKRLSLNTVRNYKQQLVRYLAVFSCPEVVTKEQRWEYFLSIPDGTHRQQGMTVIRQMHEYLFRNPIHYTELPYGKRPETLPSYFTEEEVKQLLSAITNPKQKCFAALQYLCGLRVSEVINIHLTDISTHTMPLRINGKGKKQRELPLPEAILPLLKRYWSWVQPKPRLYLFEGQYGGQYAARSMQLVIKRAKRKCGLQHKVCSTHGLRHAAATIRINKLGWSLRHTQEFLGHTHSKTTERYTHVGAEDLKALKQPVL